MNCTKSGQALAHNDADAEPKVRIRECDNWNQPEKHAQAQAQESCLSGEQQSLVVVPSTTSTELFVCWKETKLFLELATTTCLMSLGFAASPMITASCVGRLFGPVHLSGFSLANLMGNLCTQTLVTGLFGAIDTLSPQALGKGDLGEVGRLAVRGVTTSLVLLIPINLLLVLFLEDILVAFGIDHLAAHLARRWYTIFVLSLPFSILYTSICRFLTVQQIMAPVIGTSLLSTALLWPALELCARSRMGFAGTAVANVWFWVFQSLLLLAYVWFWQPHDARTWPMGGGGLWKTSMEGAALREFVVLGLGGVVAQCEWVFWEALGLVVGKLGVVAMTAHTIPTQIVFNVSTLPWAIGIALAVRMGISLPKSVARARGIALAVVGVSVVAFGAASFALYAFRGALIRIFVNPIDTNGSGNGNGENSDDDTSASVYALADSIWSDVSFFNLNVSLFSILAGVSSGLGKQWVLGSISAFFLWVFGMPMIYYKIVIRDDGGLEDAWFWMNLAYLGINVSMIVVFFVTDWYQIQDAIVGGDRVVGENKNDYCADTDNHQSLTSERKANESTALLLASESSLP